MPKQQQPYVRPPITEAVIEIKFAAQLEPAIQGSVNRAFRDEYPGEQVLQNLSVTVNMEGAAPKTDVGPATSTYRRAAADQQELLLISPESMIISQLAPYPGWDAFFDRFRRDWTSWKKVAGYRKLSRIGVRYLNRVDLADVGEIVDYSQYLKVSPSLPENLGPTLSYAIQALFPLRRIKCTLIINSGVVIPSPIPGCTSFLLDIDIGKDADVPQRDDDMFALLNEIRVEKNAVFESCVTDKARELFEWRA